LLFGCDASVSGGIGRLDDIDRLAAGRLVVLRTDGRADFGVAVRGRDAVDFGLAVVDFGLAVVALVVVVRRVVAARRVVAVRGLAVELDAVRGLVTRDLEVEDVDLEVEDFALDVDDFGLAAARRTVVAATGLAVDMVLAAAVSAFAAVVMALVAVFIACMADDMVFADDVALVAAAVILVAADVTLVAADDTVRAAEAGVAELLTEELRVDVRAAVVRVERGAVLRDRDVVLRVDREAGFRAVDVEFELADLAAVLRVVLGVALLMVRDVVFGRLAVPLDALRLTDLLRAVLAELRRLAARVMV
jgi:hypothetical protein